MVPLMRSRPMHARRRASTTRRRLHPDYDDQEDGGWVRACGDHELVEMHELVPGKRFDRYHELGQHAFGDKLGLWIIMPQQLIVEVGTNIVYMVTGGQSLKKVYDLLACGGHGGCKDIRLTYIPNHDLRVVHLPLSQFPNFSSISAISAAKGAASSAAIMHRLWSQGHNHSRQAVRHPERARGHGVRVRGTQHSPGNPSHHPVHTRATTKKPMWKGVVVAYAIVALCYFVVAFTGYYPFGNAVAPNILISLEKPRWLVAAANLMVAIHVVGSYQVFAMPVFDMMETVLVKKLQFTPGRGSGLWRGLRTSWPPCL